MLTTTAKRSDFNAATRHKTLKNIFCLSFDLFRCFFSSSCTNFRVFGVTEQTDNVSVFDLISIISSSSSDDSADWITNNIAPRVNKQMCIKKAVQQMMNSNFG